MDDNDIFTKRGITPRVRDARGYVHYDAGDRDAVLAVDPRMNNKPRWLAWVLRSAGWVMPKYPVMPVHPLFGEAPYAQLRPDEPIIRSTYGHNHPGMSHTRTDCPCGVRRHTAKFMSSLSGGRWQRAMTASERDEHEQGSAHIDPETGELLVPVNRPHVHVERAKYLIYPGPHGKRLDANPLTIAGGFRERDFVVFCLEGALKNDAIVSAGYASFNVPSVTLWDISREDDQEFALAHELYEFGYQELIGVPVVVVCDSDWHHNEHVLRQAMVVSLGLRSVTGAPVVAAAPPEGTHRGRRREKVGIDDWLGAGQDMLDIRTRMVLNTGLDRLEAEMRAAGMRKDAIAPRVQFASVVQRGSNDDGIAAVSPSAVARETGMNVRTAKRAHADLQRFAYDVVRESRRKMDGDSVRSSPPIVRLRDHLRPNIESPTLRTWLANLSGEPPQG